MKHTFRSRLAWLVLAAVFPALVAFGAPSPSSKQRGFQKRPVDWAAVNPAFAGAEFVGDATACATCHEDVLRTFEHTLHSKALGEGSAGCESCHGPRSLHVESPGDEFAWSKMTASQQDAVCMQCHEGGARFSWKGGAHRANDVSCTSCHVVMKKNTESGLLAKASGPETCYQCHREVRAEMWKVSHHPVREGRLDCSSCHNPHGSTPGLLVKNTLNETCTSCHTEKRGPFLWEHAPVRESCANCHTPHGSGHRNLLTAKDSFVCLSCHSYGGHVNLPRYNRVSNPYGSGCVNCHTQVHGSNHPSGAKQTR